MRLACIRHAASVDPEPGSNSSNNGEAGLAAGIHPRRGPCGGNARRMLHTSVGKVPAIKKRAGPKEPCSTHVSPCWCLRVAARDRCRCRQRQVYQAHSSVSSEPGRSRYLSVGGLRPRLLRTSSATTDGSIPPQKRLSRNLRNEFFMRSSLQAPRGTCYTRLHVSHSNRGELGLRAGPESPSRWRPSRRRTRPCASAWISPGRLRRLPRPL